MATTLLTHVLRTGNVSRSVLITLAPCCLQAWICLRVMLGVMEVEYHVNNRPHAIKKEGMGSDTSSTTRPGNTIREALRSASCLSMRPSKQGHNNRKRNSISSAVTVPQLYLPQSWLPLTCDSRPTNARIIEFATNPRRPLTSNRRESSTNTQWTPAAPQCTFVSTAHCGCRVLWQSRTHKHGHTIFNSQCVRRWHRATHSYTLGNSVKKSALTL